MFYKLYNRRLDNYIRVGEDDLRLSEDLLTATVFTIRDLAAAKEIFAGFTTWKGYLHVVPVGTNMLPNDCETVEAFFKARRERYEDDHL